MKDDEMERAREWRVNPETPSVIITPHGRISIGWSAQREGQFSDFTLAEETAAMIVRAVNAFAQQPEGWVLVPREPTEDMIEAHWRAHAEAVNVFADVPVVWSAMLDVAPIPGEEK